MIANAVAKGKKVLFVAEKMAALEVVKRRLESLGIGDFCLELHSNKAVKKKVLDQLKRGLDLKVWGLETDYEKELEEIEKTRNELDAYAKALYKDIDCHMSVKELIEAYESIEAEDTLRIKREHVKEDIEKNVECLGKLIPQFVEMNGGRYNGI